MNLTQTELQRLLELVSESDMHTTNCSSIENLFVKLSVEFAKRTIEKDPIVEKLLRPTEVVGNFNSPIVRGSIRFDTSTAETAKKLKVTESDLRVLRNTGELKEREHYTTGRSPRPTAIWYDLNRTCLYLHEVTWETFSQPGFDVQANTDRKIARAFERARRNQKK